jgi:allophanate hydrolase subunit 2
MSAALYVLSPGLLTTLQDLGRPGYQQLGIPVGGALDPISLRAANALVGNPPDLGALEVAYCGPSLQVDAPSVRVSFAGAQAGIEVLSDAQASCGRSMEGMRSARLERGEVLRIGALGRGAVLYMAVEGGFAVEPVLGSVSTCIRGR